MHLTTIKIFSAVVFVLTLAAAMGMFSIDSDGVPVTVVQGKLTVGYTIVDYNPTQTAPVEKAHMTFQQE